MASETVELDKRTHRWLNTMLACLAALTAVASAVAHHYTVVVRPEVCPTVSTSLTAAEMNRERPTGNISVHAIQSP